MKKCYILRGISGSGKSTRAHEILGAEGGIIHSTGSFFVKGGVWNFVPALIPRYHAMNLEAFKKSVRAGISPVVLDNCNHRVMHFIPYLKFAEIYGYEVEVIELPRLSPEVAAARSTHHVHVTTIERMLQTWEPYTP